MPKKGEKLSRPMTRAQLRTAQSRALYDLLVLARHTVQACADLLGWNHRTVGRYLHGRTISYVAAMHIVRHYGKSHGATMQMFGYDIEPVATVGNES